MDKKGISLIALIITVMVISIVTRLTYTISTDFVEQLEKNEYITALEEFERNYKIYCKKCALKNSNYDVSNMQWHSVGQPTNTGKIKDGVNEDTIQYILGQANKNLQYDLEIQNGVLCVSPNANPQKIEWASSIGIKVATTDINILDLVEGEVTYLGLKINQDNNGYITLNGGVTSQAFIKLTSTLTAADTSKGLLNAQEIIAPKGSSVKYVVEEISGSYTIESTDTTKEFNILLRTTGDVFSSKIEMIKGQRQYPANGDYEVLGNNISYAYMFIRPGIQFNNYKIKLKLLDRPLEAVDLNGENTFNIPLGVMHKIEEATGISIQCNPDYSLVFNGTCNVKKLYIALSNTPTCYNSISEMAEDIVPYSSLVSNNSEISFTVDVKGGDITIPSGGMFNVLLRTYKLNDNTHTTPISTRSDDNSEFNCKIANGIYEVTGVINNGDVRTLALYITKGVTFTNYTIKPEMLKIQYLSE